MKHTHESEIIMHSIEVPVINQLIFEHLSLEFGRGGFGKINKNFKLCLLHAEKEHIFL